ncbi:MAG: 1-deoxy-D-xylulose-5-phosphate reductoisomerase [Dehalococcoidales bacterium]
MIDRVKNIAILGSTGSIGRQTLGVVRAFPDRFRVVGLAAGNNTALLAGQIREFRPDMVYFRGGGVINDIDEVEYEFLTPEEIASHTGVDTVVIAIPGTSALMPLMAAARSGKEIALANKEALVSAGVIAVREVRTNRARILPVDSEHSAIWQCLAGEAGKPLRLILTASGGPFLDYPSEQLDEVTVDDALKHPSWQMGPKVTIDSATLMNKGLEVIEAHYLFDIPFDSIDILIHRQSIVHSMVEFADGSLKAQLSYPDMRLPIQYALSYPERLANGGIRRLDADMMKNLTFEQPEMGKFPCLEMAIEAGKSGGTCPVVLCAADEIAVAEFLAGNIRFNSIASVVRSVLEEHRAVDKPSLEDIIEADNWARAVATEHIRSEDRCH